MDMLQAKLQSLRAALDDTKREIVEVRGLASSREDLNRRYISQVRLLRDLQMGEREVSIRRLHWLDVCKPLQFEKKFCCLVCIRGHMFADLHSLTGSGYVESHEIEVTSVQTSAL